MNNTSSLFENLMLMHESDKESGRKISSKKAIKENIKKIDENDTTLLNLTVEIPTDTEDIEPEDVKVDIGVMPIETEESGENEKEEIPKDEDQDVTPEDEDNSNDGSEEETEENEEPEKEESLQLEGKDCCTGEEDCECEACKAKKEATDVDAAKKRILARSNGEDEGIIDGISNAIGSGISGVTNAVFGGKNESAKQSVKESLMHLDTTSLNKLITNFVRDNYKNIDKVIINKAMLENHKLTLKGFVKNTEGLKESLTLVNKGFDGKKLENKRFLIDFSDTNNMFNVMKESIRKPFVFTASLKDGNLKFESLDYNFKTKITEGKIAEVSGKCVLTESTKPIMEDADQVKRFNDVVDKIKAAKSANDLTACKDEMDKANLGDTLKSAAQMVWDDVNSRMKG